MPEAPPQLSISGCHTRILRKFSGPPNHYSYRTAWTFSIIETKTTAAGEAPPGWKSIKCLFGGEAIMTIQPIGNASVALYITPADLRERGLTPAGLTLEEALELTQSAFAEAGLTLEGSVEIEAYPDACGVLIFARIQPPRRLWFSFDVLEDLLAGAQILPEAPEDTALLWWEGRWWLSLPADAQRHANLLSEFGRCEQSRPHLEASLAEHGTPVLSHAAVATLLNHFPAGRE